MINPEDVPGWMQPEALVWLEEQARGARSICEVGCWRGRSTSALERGMPRGGHLVAVDSWRPTDPDESRHAIDAWDAREAFHALLADPIASGRVRVLEMDSLDASDRLEDDVFDLVFIDADHRYEYVIGDLRSYWPLVRRGGTLAGHDWGHVGVNQAVREMFGEPTRGPASLWYVVKR